MQRELGLDRTGVGAGQRDLTLRGALERKGVGALQLDRTGVRVWVLERALAQILTWKLDLHLVLAGRRITVRGKRNLGSGGVVRQRSGRGNEAVAHESHARVHGRDALVGHAQRVEKLVARRAYDSRAFPSHLLDRKDLHRVIIRSEKEIGRDFGTFSRRHQTFVARFRSGGSRVASLAIDPVERVQSPGCADGSTSYTANAANGITIEWF